MNKQQLYWTVPELALALKVPLIVVDKRIAAGNIRAELQRGKVMVPQTEVQRLMREVKTSAPAVRFPQS
jgi:hypothetical protein